MKEHEQAPQLIWKAQLNISDDHRNIRKSVIYQMQMYQLDIRIEINGIQIKNVSEIWALCTGGHESIEPKLENFSKLEKFSKEKRLKVNKWFYLILIIIYYIARI